MASRDARLSKFEVDFKQQQSKMTNKIDIVLKAITDRIAGTLPSDTETDISKMDKNKAKMDKSKHEIGRIKDYCNERIDIHYRRECEIKIDELKAKFNKMSIEINKITKEKEIRQREQVANLSTHTPEPSRRFNFTCYDDDEERTMPLNEIISQLPPSIVITTSPPVLPAMEPEDSLIMGNEELSTIPKKESDEFIKSSVEDIVPIPSESEDTSESDSECNLP
ncbi:hypothetical protein Tco_0307175 [Tanacetum coccineum]